jgi:type IV pilus assembly protein PilB
VPPNPNDPKKPATPVQQPGAPKPAVPQAGQPARPANPNATTPPQGNRPIPTAKPGTPGQVPVSKPGTPPQGGTPVAKPGQPVPQKPAQPGQPVAQRPAGTPAPAPKPPGTPPAAGAKPPAAANPAPAPKPAPKPQAKPQRPKHGHVDSSSKALGQKLVDLGFLDEAQLDLVYEEMRVSDSRFSNICVNLGYINDDQLLQATAEVHGMKVMTLEDVKPTPEAIKVVPQNMAELYKLVPLTFEADTLTVALSDPNNLEGLDGIRNLLGIRSVTAVLAPASAVEAVMAKCYGKGGGSGPAGEEESITSIIADLENDKKFKKKGKAGRETSIDLDDLTEMANSAPVRKLINMVLLMAIRDHASDIHFEPFEDEYKMRYRCDGVLYEMVPPPRHLAAAISSRIKVMSNLDIAERRLPQDGRIELNVGGNRVDMRVSVLPTMFGESVVVRVLDRSNVGLDLGRIGMVPHLLAQFRECIHKPNGIVFVTGPTGSGKTTTLYSALSELNDIETKIITTEDPVEYEIDGLIQVPINAEIDMTFAAALRAILRQDPDVILVGEVRDLETAQIAIQASLTGHLVFSTLHTNDAPSSITRLRDMGVEPFLITATVEAIQAQRLVRRVCSNCRTWYDPTRDQLMELALKPDQLKGKFAFGEGCEKCNNLGFKGRTGLYELLIMEDDLRDMISKGSSTDALRNHVRKRGTLSLRDAGLAALYEGLTTLDEIVRETVTDDES